MKHRLLEWLACPKCGTGDLDLTIIREIERPISHGHFEPEESGLAGIDFDRMIERDVIEGSLRCKGCDQEYTIVEGIPHMLPSSDARGPATAHRWTTFDTGMREWEDSFLDYAHPLGATDFLGRLVLDAGCGYGRHAYFAARFGAV